MVQLKDQQPGGDVFFVLGGLVNGEDGCLAHLSGPPNSPVLKDGWYWLRDGDADPHIKVPYKSREAATRALQAWLKRCAPGVKVLGHVFREMTPEESMAFSGAEPGTLMAMATDGTTLFFDPASNDITEVLPDEDSALSITDRGEIERCWSFTVIR
jgi:hypothetical protein